MPRVMTSTDPEQGQPVATSCPIASFNAIWSNGAAFLACHNHPCGIATPSREDIEITRRLKEDAEFLGVRFLNHISIGKGVYCSFVDDGYWCGRSPLPSREISPSDGSFVA
jgi:hypothetical protein